LSAKLDPETASNNPAATATTRNLVIAIFVANADLSAAPLKDQEKQKLRFRLRVNLNFHAGKTDCQTMTVQ